MRFIILVGESRWDKRKSIFTATATLLCNIKGKQHHTSKILIPIHFIPKTEVYYQILQKIYKTFYFLLIYWQFHKLLIYCGCIEISSIQLFDSKSKLTLKFVQRMPIPVLSITINKMQINNGLISEAINVKQSGEPSFHTHVTKGCWTNAYTKLYSTSHVLQFYFKDAQ